MAIKFKGVKKAFTECVIVDDPPHSDQRARWADGFWADVCTRHFEIFKKNSSSVKAKKDPMWFLKPKSK